MCHCDHCDHACDASAGPRCLFTGRLDKFEIPSRIGLTSVVWSPDNNLVTAAFKLKRRELSSFYREDLRRIYN